jgi:peptide chain release factor 1
MTAARCARSSRVSSSSAPGVSSGRPARDGKLDQLVRRLDELNALLSSEDATRDLGEFKRLSREHAEISPIVARYRDYKSAESDLAAATEMLADPATRTFAEAEAKDAKEKMAALEEELQRLLLPRDPNDDRNIFLEVRAGTGGDESAIFAGDLFRMYMRYAERHGWPVEVLSSSASDLGGYKEVIARIVARAPTRSSSSSRAVIACSECRSPRRKGASIPPRRRSR